MTEFHGEKYLDELERRTRKIQLVLMPREAEAWNKDIYCSLAVAYPVKDAIVLAGREYFDNSIPWMIALAVLENYERIVLTGVEYGSKTLWKARRDAADMLEEYKGCREITVEPKAERNKTLIKLINNLRGILSGDESWAVPCISYHLGIAQARGIETVVVAGEKSGLFVDKWSMDGKPALYGLSKDAGGSDEHVFTT